MRHRDPHDDPPAKRRPEPYRGQSIAAVTHNYLTSISTSGVPAEAQPSAADLSDGVTGTGNVVLATTPTLITPVLGVATGTSLAVTGKVTSTGPAGGIGYATGAGGAVTQATNKATTVVLNAVCGAITLNNAASAAGAIVSFTLTNSSIAVTDVLILNHSNVGTPDADLLGPIIREANIRGQ